MPDSRSLAYHTPVLLDESVAALVRKPNGVYADLTCGGGGHAREILSRLQPEGRLFCFDRDEEALKNLPIDPRLIPIHSDFRHLAHWMEYYDQQALDGVLIDLGVSSHQFDVEERGFSYRFNGPLDMRMNRAGGRTAADVLNSASAEALARMWRDYGEIREANRIAKVVEAQRAARPFQQTADLIAACRDAVGAKGDEWHYLAKVFQALRIEVNGELTALEELLASLPKLLAPGARLVVISYHSLEDRIVKRFLRGEAPRSDEAFLRGAARQSPFAPVGKGIVRPSHDEIAANARSRSACMRVGERCQPNQRVAS